VHQLTCRMAARCRCALHLVQWIGVLGTTFLGASLGPHLCGTAVHRGQFLYLAATLDASQSVVQYLHVKSIHAWIMHAGKQVCPHATFCWTVTLTSGRKPLLRQSAALCRPSVEIASLVFMGSASPVRWPLRLLPVWGGPFAVVPTLGLEVQLRPRQVFGAFRTDSLCLCMLWALRPLAYYPASGIWWCPELASRGFVAIGV
jgi:hypothetical protein